MIPVLVLNDAHLGVQRSAGTTPASAFELRRWLLHNLHTQMMQHLEGHIIFNGDLFDEFSVPIADVLTFYEIATAWLEVAEPNTKLILSAGNHDLAKDSSRLSSLEFIGRILQSRFSERVVLVKLPQEVFPGIYVVPHLLNQDLFDRALSEVPAGMRYILLHANYDNYFAAQSDHSLNVSEAQARKLYENGAVLIFGHEHPTRRPKPRVRISGNQWPSSVADCVGQQYKFCTLIDDKGLHEVETWRAEGEYSEVDWCELSSLSGNERFVRVIGEATREQAADVIKVVAKLRQQHHAFVIANAVKVEGLQAMDAAPADLDGVHKFDVLGFLLEQLDEEQRATVESLLQD